jgi:hypothetical protein
VVRCMTASTAVVTSLGVWMVGMAFRVSSGNYLRRQLIHRLLYF